MQYVEIKIELTTANINQKFHVYIYISFSCVLIDKLQHNTLVKSCMFSRHYRHIISFTLIKWQVNYGIGNTEMKHYYVATIPCFEIHRRQTECVCAEKDSDAREVSKIKATRGRDLLEGNGLTLQRDRDRIRDRDGQREREKKKTSWCVRSQRGKETQIERLYFTLSHDSVYPKWTRLRRRTPRIFHGCL